MKRFIDPLFFTVLFVIDVAVWVFAALFGTVPPSVIVMAPAFFGLALLALVRVLVNLEAKRFYVLVAAAAAVFALSLWVTQLLTPPLESFDFTGGTWVLTVSGLGALLGLFLAVVGAIPSPERVKLEKSLAEAKKSEEKQRQKADQQAQKAQQQAQKKAQKEERRAQKDGAREERSQRGDASVSVEPVDVQVTEVISEED